MKVGILKRQPSAFMRMVVAVAVTALLLSVAPSQAQAQKALDLPGMSLVAEHHGLSEVTLQDAWMDHVREAVMITQGWVWVGSLKEGGEPATSEVVACERIEQLLLSGELLHTERTSFHPCQSGGFVQLLPNAYLDKLVQRYLINANAKLNR